MSPKNLNVIKKNHKNLKNKLNNNQISRIYQKFEKNFHLKTNFIVAVSGGPDSLALAFCAKIYAIKNKLQPKFIYGKMQVCIQTPGSLYMDEITPLQSVHICRNVVYI